MKIGELDVSKIYLESAEIEKIYLGTSQVYGGSEPTPTPYDEQYLTIESTSDNNTISLVTTYTGITRTVSASTDNGVTWTEYTSSTGGTQIASLNAGQKVLLKGENSQYSTANTTYNYFTSIGQFNVYGNIMSLISGDSFENADTLTGACALNKLFSQCSGLTSAENFILPATTLIHDCYKGMFQDCTSLTSAPSLPATTLANYCYQAMFRNCTSLTTAPVLSATTLVKFCYQTMFYGCRSLNYIKCLATDISASNCTMNWVNSVASTGTFVKAASMNDWTTDNNGIPNNWTVQNDDGSQSVDNPGGDNWDDQE